VFLNCVSGISTGPGRECAGVFVWEFFVMYRPTIRQVFKYYARPDISRYIFEASQKWHLVLIIPQKKHWEIGWSKHTVTPRNPGDLVATIEARMSTEYAHLRSHDTPPYYPSFHAAVRTTDLVQRNKPRVPYGYVIESDAGGWKKSFKAVYPAMSELDAHGVFFRHKFSGHRSLHVIVPEAAFPRFVGTLPIIDMWQSALNRVHRAIYRKKTGHTHMLPEVVRLPYSLNEDTGRASLPLLRDEVNEFHPSIAEIDRVQINSDWEHVPEKELASADSILRRSDLNRPAASERDAEFFLKELKTASSTAKRCKAIDKLLHMNAAGAVDALIDVCDDRAVKVRRVAVQGLHGLAQHAVDHITVAAALLKRVETDSDPVIRASALQALTRHDQRTTREAVRVALADQSFQVRRRAVGILAEMDAHNATEELEIACNHEDDRIRKIACEALRET